MAKRVVGIDFGGTYIKSGLVDADGKLWKTGLHLSQVKDGPEAILRRLKKAVSEMITFSGGDAEALGIATPGLVDNEGRVFEAPNLPEWHDIPLVDIFQAEFGLPVRVENDVNAFTWSEFVFGAGKPFETIIGLTLGTGVGGGVVLNGRLLRGGHYSAMEIGHLTINSRGPRCNCGAPGCLERYVGSDALVARAGRAVKRGESPALEKMCGGDIGILTAEMIGKAAAKGDKASLAVWREAGRDIGVVMAGIVNLFNPEAIVIGGGVAQAGPPLFKAIEETIRERALKMLSRETRVLPASLGRESGILAAASLHLVSSQSKPTRG